jgi:hypothetical protein
MIAVSLAALVITLTREIAASTITGIGAGLLLLCYAVIALARPVRR